MPRQVDVAIVGGGMVGAALALLLVAGARVRAERILVVEPRPVSPPAPGSPPALRVSAIAPVNRARLAALGVWDRLDATRVASVERMAVWHEAVPPDSPDVLHFDAAESGAAELGCIVENDALQAALQAACRKAGIALPGESLQALDIDADAARLQLGAARVDAELVVGADGANSWLRNKADIPLTFWDYRHHALVPTIRTEEPHGGVARQIFHKDGILAFLPLSDPHLCSIVWSLVPEKAQLMREATPEAFNQALCMAFDNRLGLCTLESERLVFPLTGRYARQFAAHRLALVGDAAHTIHPLAGQGVNLGFMDAAELVNELRRLHREGKDIGQHLYLRRYERSRKHSAAVMLAGMQGFRELFAGANPAKKLLRDIGLKLADTLPGVKPQLLRQAMGLNDLPDWLR